MINLNDKLKKGLLKHFVDTTAINVIATPTMVAVERFNPLKEIPEEISINARVFGLGLGYLGLCYAIAKGRDFSRKFFKINDKTREYIQFIHDAVYLATFNTFFCPMLYYASGSRDIKEITTGTALNIFLDWVLVHQ